MIRRDEILEVFAKLREFIAAEPRLASFLPAADELHKQAQAFAQGTTRIPPLTLQSSDAMPDRDSARAIVLIMSKLPALDGDETTDLARAYATLLGNLADGITVAIYKSYPEVVPRD
jgi:hypothetical protein